MKHLIALISILIFALNTSAQNPAHKKGDNKQIFDNYIQFMGNVSKMDMMDIVTKSALFFLETPYVGHTLEKEPEQLVVNLGELDCTTFVETVLALSRTVRDKEATYEKFLEQLKYIRYRDGVITDYSSRLHYTTDWIYENEQKGIVKNVTREAGGVPHKVTLYIMSTNHDKYKQLKGKPGLTEKIRNIEAEASKRDNYRIPANEIEKNSKSYRNGDIVGFVTKTPGIDISHVGFIFHDKGKLTFIHASSVQKKVVVEQESLMNYAVKSKNGNGIMVARPL
jgi:hypothetical protein